MADPAHPLNPRLSGYAVFNRRCNRNGWQANPISEWTWSLAPAHPAVFSVEDWAQFMRMDAAARTTTDPLERLRAAAAERGHAVERVRGDAEHVVYAIGDRQFTVPAGDLPPAAAESVLSWLETT